MKMNEWTHDCSYYELFSKMTKVQYFPKLKNTLLNVLYNKNGKNIVSSVTAVCFLTKLDQRWRFLIKKSHRLQ